MLIILISSVSVLMIASAGYLVYDLNSFKSRMCDELSTEAQIIGDNAEAALTFDDKKAATEVLSALKGRSQILRATIFDRNQMPFAEFSSRKITGNQTPKVVPGDGVTVDANGISVYHKIRSKSDIVGTLYIRSNLQEWIDRRDSFVKAMAVLLIICALVSCLIGFRLQRIISAPVLELTKAVRAVSYDQKVDFGSIVRSHDEIGELVGGFDLMLERINERDLALQQANENLELRVHQRTAELEAEITERKAAQEQLSQSEKHLSDFFDNASVGLHWVGQDGTILRANRAELQMLGYEENEYVGKNICDFHVDSSTANQKLKLLFEGEQITGHEAKMICKNGDIKIVSIESSVLKEENKIVHSRCFTRDITAEKEAAIARAEQERAEEANNAKNEFLSRTSHELRTPMNAIMGFSQLLEMENLTENQNDSVRRILSAGKHLLRVIDDVLDISKIEGGNISIWLEPVSISDVIASSMSLVRHAAEQKQVTVHIDLSDSVDAHVLGDRQRLIQVTLNLLTNAVKYNQNGGEVFVSVEKCGEFQRLLVRDTGKGIPTDKLSRIFTPFERLGAENTNVEGTGLGLAVSKRLCEAMSAKIGMIPMEEGACFHVDMLEVERRTGTGAFDILDEPEMFLPSSSRAKVLSVEDNSSNNHLVEKVLSLKANIQLVVCERGEDALELAMFHQPDVILLDLNLPGIQGEQVLLLLKQNDQTKNIPVIVVSANVTAAKITSLKSAGILEFITKPIDVSKLLQTIDLCLGSEDRKIA